MAPVMNVGALRAALQSSFSSLNSEEEIEAFEKEGVGHLGFTINDTTEITLDCAVKAIKQFKTDMPNLCFTFSLDDAALKTELKKRVLTIYRTAVSISDGWAPEGAKTEHVDALSRSFVEEPVKCTQSHYFEKRRIVLWDQRKKNQCPCDGDGPHAIYPTSLSSAVDLKVLGEIKVQSKRAKEEHLKTAGSRSEIAQLLDERNTSVEKLRDQLIKQKKEIDELQAELNERDEEVSGLSDQSKQQASEINELKDVQSSQADEVNRFKHKLVQPVLPVVAAVGKIVFKTTAATLITFFGKLIAKQSVEIIGKAIVKYIPFVSLAIGIGLAAYRVSQVVKRWQSDQTLKANLKNEWPELLKAVGELASGGIAIVPVWGTAASITLDVAIAMGDAAQIWIAKKSHNEAVDSIELSYQALGVEPDASPEEIRKGYISQAARMHPDKNQESPILQEYSGELMKDLNTQREIAEGKR